MTNIRISPLWLCLLLIASGADAASLGAKAAASIEEMVPDEQLVQRCDMETLERLDAERVLPYAFAPIEYEKNTVIAAGAAYRRAGKWYRLQFSCVASSDNLSIQSYRFSKGDLVPRSEWESHNLFP
ncbi:DUF930 domain-containing protein [uncultured Cohaesibacter sp.]|uniref:DUF930 domain-containing protein n=1 Tax=uncultured Cohaesibacter sp. TaxID=1002546 RepID=UPI0029C69815|nr:DUF930 domain-containing protein [uncultured Cohaesibacter sp.]